MGPQLAFASPVSQFGFERFAEHAAAWADGVRATVARHVTKLVATQTPVHARAKSVQPVQAAQRVQAVPGRMTLADQWSKITSVLVRSVEGASAVKDMQSAATQQLDLAQYGLSTLVDELAAVMAMPGQANIAPSRYANSATVHAFGANIEAAGSVIAAAKARALAA